MVKYKKFESDSMVGLIVSGHASEYPEHHGNNIVCAAVSTVCDMAAIGCGLYCNDIVIKSDNGYMSIISVNRPETIAIITAAMFELDRIKDNYPYCFEGGNRVNEC